MNPSLIIDYQDPKYSLLNKIFNVIDSEESMKIYARNNVGNVKKMAFFIKLIFTSMYFEYSISDLIFEKQNKEKLRKFLNDDGYFEDPASVYNYMSKLNEQQLVNIVNSILKKLNNNKRCRKTYIVDGTAIACDINTIKQYVTKERLEKLNLKWGYSENKKYFIGFKLTMTLDKDTLVPVSILIHSGTPNDAQIFHDVLKELKRRRIIKYGDIILFDKGYFSHENYIIGITQYKIIPIIFPRQSFNIQKLKDQFSYPLEVFKKSKNNKELKRKIKTLFKQLLLKIENWKELKPIRGIIEDFFKVSKEAFKMDQLHKYTEASVKKTSFLCILLTTLAVNNGYASKTGMQQLAEGKLNQKPLNKNKKKNKPNKRQIQFFELVPEQIEEIINSIFKKEYQSKLEKFSKK